MAKKSNQDMSGVVVFGLSNSENMTKEICENLGIPQGKIERTVFADGEILLQAGTSVRGKEVYIIQSTSAPVNDALMEVLILTDALRRASAGIINVVTPYYGYSRQDRKASGRQPITARLVADLMYASGVNRIIAFDLHAAQIQGFFNFPCDDLRGMPALGEHISKMKLKDIVVVSPDHGGAARARKLASYLGNDIPVAIVDKRRTGANQAEVMAIIGDVDGKNAIMIDDMIDTGGTIVKGAEAIRNAGAKSVIVCATHGLFSGPAVERLQGSDAIERVVITNTIEQPKEKMFKKLEVVSVAPFIADIIRAINNKDSISDVYDKHTKGKMHGG